MCEKRIEKVTLGDGVSKAKCSKETKKLKVVFDDAKTSVNKIEFEVATFGHNARHHIATTEVFLIVVNMTARLIWKQEKMVISIKITTFFQVLHDRAAFLVTLFRYLRQLLQITS